MKKIFCLIVLNFLFIVTYAHSGKPSEHIIIDTDCAIDDLRAITMLLANHKFEVMAIIVSDGSLKAKDGISKITALLDFLNHQGIKVGIGKFDNFKTPAWNEFNKGIIWGKDNSEWKFKIFDADSLIYEEAKNEKLTFVCLGSLSNISESIKKHPDIKSHIEKIIWYNDSYNPLNGYNYNIDTKAADYILNSSVNIDIISNSETSDEMLLDTVLLSKIYEQKTIYSEAIRIAHSSKAVNDLIKEKHLKIADELIPCFLQDSSLFAQKTYDKIKFSYPLNSRINDLKKLIINFYSPLLNNENRVFQTFPIDTLFYSEDVRKAENEIINKYGIKEWRAAVLANELHGHLGIFALIGVKMGLRAREFFDIGVDDMYVLSSAGSKPPISCMNDGLQVATGGTMGHGLFALTKEGSVKPEAVFEFKNKKIKITLKEVYFNQIMQELEYGVKQYGLDTEQNWNYVRQLAIKYWLTLDRDKIFDINTL